MNKNSLLLFNELLTKHQQFIASHSLKYGLIQTDSYQGKLQEFIMDVTERIMQDSCMIVKEQLREENYR